MYDWPSFTASNGSKQCNGCGYVVARDELLSAFDVRSIFLRYHYFIWAIHGSLRPVLLPLQGNISIGLEATPRMISNQINRRLFRVKDNARFYVPKY